MIYRFDGFEVDTRLREVRASGAARPLQPQAFAVLAYLLEHRERVVPKRELLTALWPDVVVSESSVQRAVSLARAAIDDEGTRIRTVPRQGYRFAAEVEVVVGGAPALPPGGFVPRFARSGEVHIAYHTVGSGPLDLVVVPGWVFPMRAFFGLAALGSLVDALAEFGRVILFDKRGTGLSDRVKSLPTLEERMDDLRAVLEEVESKQAVIVGCSEGGPLSLLYATHYPERTRGLVLIGSFPRWTVAPGFDHGMAAEVVGELREYIQTSWGTGRTMKAIVSSRADDPEVAAWASRAEQEGASPGAALDLLEMNVAMDVRPLLPAVSVPTALLHQAGDPIIPVESSRYLAARLPFARLFEFDGTDHMIAYQGLAELREALAWLLAREPRLDEQVLTTIIHVEAAQRDVERELDAVARAFGGQRAGTALAWRFEGPQRAIRCAHALTAALSDRDRGARAGVHTGEVTGTGEGLRGEALAIAEALAHAARPGEVRVSQVVRDLVHGSSLRFEERAPVRVDRKRLLTTLASVAPSVTPPAGIA